MSFQLLATCRETSARAGVIKTAHGDLLTPVIMPVGTQSTAKSLTPSDLRRAGAHCVLANTYLLALGPGANLVKGLGDLHRFMAWNGPILTESSGSRKFSLAGLRELSESGVRFHSHLDQRPLELTQEGVVRTQEALGSDFIMPLGVCVGPGASADETVDALERARRWWARSLGARSRPDQLLFGIVRGGLDQRLRREAAVALCSLDFPGYAVGSLSVGKPLEATAWPVMATTAELPLDRPRYLMGVGTPEQVLAYTAHSVDIFDCVLPTLLGRTRTALGRRGRRLKLTADAPTRGTDPA